MADEVNNVALGTGGQEPIETPNDNPPPIEPPTYKYEEVNKKEMSEIAREEPPREEVKVEEPKVPEVDQEALNRQIAEDAANKVLEEQEARRLAQEEAIKAETPQEDAYTKWAKELWEKEKRDPTYTEALNFVKDQAISEIQTSQQEQARKAQEAQEAQQRAQAEETTRINSYVDDELNDLYKSNKLTPIVDKDNPSDQGVVERKSLFETWAKVNTERRAAGQPDIISATRIAEFYWKKPSAQPAGENAPVMSSRSATTPPGEQKEYTNADLKKPWSFWKRGQG